MRTLLSQELTARWLATGDQDRQEMLSSGGDASWTSLTKSPTTVEAGAVGFPKSEAIVMMAAVVVSSPRKWAEKWKAGGWRVEESREVAYLRRCLGRVGGSPGDFLPLGREDGRGHRCLWIGQRRSRRVEGISVDGWSSTHTTPGLVGVIRARSSRREFEPEVLEHFIDSRQGFKAAEQNLLTRDH
jgi:hypothetical protein